MKIDTSCSNLDPTVESERTQAAKRAEMRAADRAATDTRSDAVVLSPDAQLAAKAVADANRSDDVRASEVERAKNLLASGELGKDAHRLADAILDRLLMTNDLTNDLTND
jgi:flagellar biosynthesis anti-sigma factor FlgM